jgi:hypothetical protein
VLGIFKINFHKLFAWGWLRTVILLISASWEARITGMSHQHMALDLFNKQCQHIHLYQVCQNAQFFFLFFFGDTDVWTQGLHNC